MDPSRDNLDILIVDDDAVTRAQLRFLLVRNGYRVFVAENGQDGWKMMQERYFPICITDWSMPGMDGPDLCRLVRTQIESEDYNYMILLTGMSEKAQITTGLEAGADDYITKPFDTGELLARLRVGRRILRLQHDMRETQRKLHMMASRDGLTNVMNRRALDESLDAAIARVGRGGRPVSVAILDIDFFKKVNDTHGHLAGDAVLKEVADRIRQVTRSHDLVGRYGGEEFVVILDGADASAAEQVATRMRIAIEEVPVAYGDTEIAVTASVGLATADAGYRGNVAGVVDAADGALYEAKRGGRNRVTCAPLLSAA